MKETVDAKRVGVLDAGSTPATSTKTLLGRNVHGVKTKGYYYTENEWARIGMLGPLPPERNRQLLKKEHGGDIVSTRRIEILEEDSDT